MPMQLNTLSNLRKLKGVRVLLRVDFNVSVGVKGDISEHDDKRIRAAVPTIEHLLDKGAKVILISHLGRPEGREKKYSLEPAAKHLGMLLGREVGFVKESIEDDEKVDRRLAKMKDGDVVMLENIRFYSGEGKNNVFLARRLAAFADIFVNDAFAVAHREHASTAGVAELLPSYAGKQMAEEVKQLTRLLKDPEHPYIVLLGGAKISTKLPVIKKLLPLADKILIGGGMANNFFRARKLEVGRSLVSRKDIGLAKTLLGKKKIVLPKDVIVAKKLSDDADIRVTVPEGVRKDEYIVDIGPETMRSYASELKKGQTLVWNGPVGISEIKKFSHGSVILARVVASRAGGKAFGVVGGGDTLPVLSKTKMEEYVDHVSTGGGALLDFLAGKLLPAITPLIMKKEKSVRKKAVVKKVVKKPAKKAAKKK